MEYSGLANLKAAIKVNNQRRVVERTLQAGQPMLLVSLPRNDLGLAQAAIAGGAQCLKVHLNIAHYASGTHFGSLEREGPVLEEIVGLGVPVGVVPGGEAMASQQDMQRLDEMGIDFFDAYVHHLPRWMLEMDTAMSAMIALSHRQKESGFSLDPYAPHCDMIEASIVEPDGYGQPLAADDLRLYEQIIARYPDLPVVVPTQRCITPDQVAGLLDIGVRGILIGAIVTGRESTTLEAATSRFREVLDAVGHPHGSVVNERRPTQCP